ncbi:hypothetical protein F0P96_10470 [Hymenobacter busanensis]|uniref:Uncharacterized protein n=1 Tax=Hymenobacter busanensis TaxID=2607656 RepID=A0A7L4ZYL6_9BACT|nr:hypothetical protein [Hymenobacter busanensis]KAA9333384.1 hypothetical protein F0P96_10470 [Hymenobacter busanensis]QHJ07936.1 hypothetical protein GUY19_11835 [Hymenobacter busanensis]
MSYLKKILPLALMSAALGGGLMPGLRFPERINHEETNEGAAERNRKAAAKRARKAAKRNG